MAKKAKVVDKVPEVEPEFNLDAVKEALETEPENPEAFRGLKNEEERRIARLILPYIQAKAQTFAEGNASKRLSITVEELKNANKIALDKAINELQERSKPPSVEELGKLLSQEYLEFTIEIATGSGKETFTIRELPQAIEKKIVASLRKGLMPFLKELVSVEWTTGVMVEKLARLIEIVPGMLDLLSENVAIMLDPWSEDKRITTDWVQKHLSSFRIVAIIQAQLEANKIRDFFSTLSRAIPS